MKPMAKKLKLMQLFQELKGRAEISERRPASTGTGIYLMQLREQASRATQPRVRLMISVTADEPPTPADPVKINHVHVTAETAPAPTRPAQRPVPKVPQVRPDAA
jgi:hypothetical protein